VSIVLHRPVESAIDFVHSSSIQISRRASDRRRNGSDPLWFEDVFEPLMRASREGAFLSNEKTKTAQNNRGSVTKPFFSRHNRDLAGDDGEKWLLAISATSSLSLQISRSAACACAWFNRDSTARRVPASQRGSAKPS
jgi:hypothetical protein